MLLRMIRSKISMVFCAKYKKELMKGGSAMSNYYYTLIDGKLYYKKRKNHKWKLVTAS